MKPYCLAPFVHLYQHNTDFDNKVCCVAKQPITDGITNIKDKWTSSYYQDIRTRMLTPGSELPECEGCTTDREDYNYRFKDWDLQFNVETGNQYNSPIDYDLRPGNLCNLGCRMCSPVSSSTLNKEYKKHEDTFEKAYIKSRRKKEHYVYAEFKDGCDWTTEENIEYILESLKHTNRIKFLGGEPTIMPSVLELLDRMIEQKLTDVELFFTTNCTNENQKFMNRIKHFNNVRFHFSIDGTGKTYEYIRKPAHWNKIEQRLTDIAKLKQHCKPECNITIQAYNVTNLKDFLYWLKDKNTTAPIGLNTVELTHPSWFSYKVLPVSFRNRYLEALHQDHIMNWSVVQDSNLPEVLESMLNCTETGDTKLFSLHTKTFDTVRKQNINDYIPELGHLVYG